MRGIRIVASVSIIVSLGLTCLMWLFALSIPPGGLIDFTIWLLTLSSALIILGSILLMKSNSWGLLLFFAGTWGFLFWSFHMTLPTLPGEEYKPITSTITSPSVAIWFFFLGSLIYFFKRFGFTRYLPILLILMLASFTIYFYVTTEALRLAAKASNPATSADELRRVFRRSQSLDWWNAHPIQLDLAENPSTPIDILEVLTMDTSDHVRAAVVDNPSATREILLRLYNDSWPYVRVKAAKRLNIPFPEIKITGLKPNSQLSKNVTIAWQTLNAPPNSRVKLWIEEINDPFNDYLKVSNGSPNGSFSWDTTEILNGPYGITVDLFDANSTYIDSDGFEVEVINN